MVWSTLQLWLLNTTITDIFYTVSAPHYLQIALHSYNQLRSTNILILANAALLLVQCKRECCYSWIFIYLYTRIVLYTWSLVKMLAFQLHEYFSPKSLHCLIWYFFMVCLFPNILNNRHIVILTFLSPLFIRQVK